MSLNSLILNLLPIEKNRLSIKNINTQGPMPFNSLSFHSKKIILNVKSSFLNLNCTNLFPMKA